MRRIPCYQYQRAGNGWINQTDRPQTRVRAFLPWGSLDYVQPRAAAETFQRQIPGAQLIIYPGVGHDVIEETPAISERDAEDFLARAARAMSESPADRRVLRTR
jgi:pimeloyl-ACP methyl ester carboxylesterase